MMKIYLHFRCKTFLTIISVSAREQREQSPDSVPRVIIVAIVLGSILFVIIKLMIITCCIKQRKENRRREEKKLGKTC